MEYNIPDNYVDTKPAPMLDKKTLNEMAFKSCFLQASFNYERMQAAGWLYSILPGLKKIHTNKEDLSTSMSHNLEFFNTHPFLVTFVMGIILSLEQNKANVSTIRAVRVAAMGPLGGIGDAIFWFTLVPISAGITANMAIKGNIIAPVLFLLIFNSVQFVLRYWLMHWSYNLGVKAIDIFTSNAKEFTRAAAILGVFIVGALTSLYGATKVNVKIQNGETSVPVTVTTQVKSDKLDEYLQENGVTIDDVAVTDLTDDYKEVTITRYKTEPVVIDIQSILDGVLPQIIPLTITLSLYGLMTKKTGRKWTPIQCIGLLLVLALLGSGFGIWPSIW